MSVWTTSCDLMKSKRNIWMHNDITKQKNMSAQTIFHRCPQLLSALSFPVESDLQRVGFRLWNPLRQTGTNEARLLYTTNLQKGQGIDWDAVASLHASQRFVVLNGPWVLWILLKGTAQFQKIFLPFIIDFREDTWMPSSVLKKTMNLFLLVSRQHQ